MKSKNSIITLSFLSIFSLTGCGSDSSTSVPDEDVSSVIVDVDEDVVEVEEDDVIDVVEDDSSIIFNLVNNADITDASNGPSHSLALIDLYADDTAKLRLSLDDAMETGKISFNIFYPTGDDVAAYFTLFGQSALSDNAIAELKMDPDSASSSDNVGIKLRVESDDLYISEYSQGEWNNISIAWDTNQSMYIVEINDVVIGQYEMHATFDVEKIDFKFSTKEGLSVNALYIDDVILYSDVEGSEKIFSDNFEETELAVELNDNEGYDSVSHYAFVSNVENSTSSADLVPNISLNDDYQGFVIDGSNLTNADPVASGRYVAISDTDESSAGKLRLDTDESMDIGSISAMIQYPKNEYNTAYFTLFGQSTSGVDAIGELKMDADSAFFSDNVGIKLKADVDYYIAEFPAGEWVNLVVSWSITAQTYTVSMNGTDIGTYDMFNVDSVSHIDFKFASNLPTSENQFLVDNIMLYSNIASTLEVFSDNFENTAIGTDLGTSNNPNYSTLSLYSIVTE